MNRDAMNEEKVVSADDVELFDKERLAAIVAAAFVAAAILGRITHD